MQSNQFALNESDWKSVLKSGIKYLIPVVILYLTTVGATLQTEGHVIQSKDFIPNSYMIGGIITYVMSVITNISAKFLGGK